MAKRVLSAAALLAAVVSGEFDSTGTSRTKKVLPPQGAPAAGLRGADEGARRLQSGPIYYRGGTIMKNLTAYYIWYGTWSASQKAILEDMAASMGNSGWMNIEQTYYDNAGPTNGIVNWGGSTTDAYSLGTSLTDANIWTIVSSALSSGRLPTSTDAVYFVNTASDVTATSGLCTQYCGWHDYRLYGTKQIKFALIGYSGRCLSGCSGNVGYPSLNGDAGVDGMASILAHELVEAQSDPVPGTGWTDATGYENADKCAWTWGTTSLTPAGGRYNVQWGSRYFLIQQNWVQVPGAGFCANSYAATPSSTPTPSPTASLSVGASPSATPTGSNAPTTTRTPSRSATPTRTRKRNTSASVTATRTRTHAAAAGVGSRTRTPLATRSHTRPALPSASGSPKAK